MAHAGREVAGISGGGPRAWVPGVPGRTHQFARWDMAGGRAPGRPGSTRDGGLPPTGPPTSRGSGLQVRVAAAPGRTGWPTLYGKTGAPRRTFWANEGLHTSPRPNRGRRVCNEADQPGQRSAAEGSTAVAGGAGRGGRGADGVRTRRDRRGPSGRPDGGKRAGDRVLTASSPRPHRGHVPAAAGPRGQGGARPPACRRGGRVGQLVVGAGRPGRRSRPAAGGRRQEARRGLDGRMARRAPGAP
ncbi:uncharacterized protein N7482_010789 [Penicillium canariense]|uniref:Uncharacterized protein n=1 Tax=Penicillium canariense TaxID=189055 RepID=A0A9W9LEP8_9EURO|nr:uncharacterized protein N7482_010789 [Penicillium canariense]KAJ5151537.1 hypothetical protein N7482_010789 [Penicillium canariense]